MALRCPTCDAPLAPDSAEGLCPACLFSGLLTPAAADAPQTEIVISGGGHASRQLLGAGEYVVGREATCHIAVNHETVSARHALLTIERDSLFVADLGSERGTFLNKQRVTHSTRIWSTQKVQIGDVTIELRRVQRTGHPGKGCTGRAEQEILPRELLGERKYEVGHVVAQGGMGAILAARDAAIERTVAMKVMLDPTDRNQIARFIAEARITAQLQHPSIVPIHEIGVDAHGDLFYTMKLIEGVTLHEVLERLKAREAQAVAAFSLTALLTVFQKACDAVAFAHAKRVVHRDLKPENIMIGEFGEVLVMDWGLAKVIAPAPGEEAMPGASRIPHTAAEEPDAGENSLARPEETRIDQASQTIAGTVMGTPHFMAPEQARGEVEKIDVRTDVFSLGAILYSILTLQPPTTGETVKEILEKRKRGEISRASSPKSSNQPSSVRGGRIPGALLAVATKALSLRPEDRYQTVPEFQKEIGAFQGGFATAAERAGLGRQLMLLVSRHKALSASIALSIVVVAMLTAISVLRIRASERRAVETLSESDFVQALRSIEEGRNQDAVAQLVRSLSRGAQNEPALRRLQTLLTYGNFALPVAQLHHSGGEVHDAQFSEDGKRVVTASFDKTAQVWDVESRRPIGPPMKHQGNVWTAQFSPDGKRVATASLDKTARIWDAESGVSTSEPLKHDDRVRSVQFSPDGTSLLTASWDGTARLWDAESGTPRGETMRHKRAVASARFNPDGRKIVTASSDKTARVWDATSGNPLTDPLPHARPLRMAEFSADSTRVVTACYDSTAIIWDAQTGQPLAKPLVHEGPVWTARFSPDGKQILTASHDKTARLWNAETGELLMEPLKHDHWVTWAEFSPDAQHVITSSFDKTARVWSAQTGKPTVEPLRHRGEVLVARFNRDGTQVVTASLDGTGRVWDVRNGTALTEPLTHHNSVHRAQFSPDGKLVATACADTSAWVWDVAIGKPLRWLRHGARVGSAEFSPDGRRIVTASDDGTASLWELVPGRDAPEILPHGVPVVTARFSSDGRKIVTISLDQKARIWDAQNGKLLPVPLPHPEGVRSAEFSPDGQKVVTASADRNARVWDVQTGKEILPPLRHEQTVTSARFSPDGKQIVTASYDRTARLWDATSGTPKGPPMVHNAEVKRAQFSPNGKVILTGSNDHTAKLWDSSSGRLLADPLKHGSPVSGAEFSPDGNWIVTICEDDRARIWDSRNGRLISEHLRHNWKMTSARFGPESHQVVISSDDGTAKVWDLWPVNGNTPVLLRIAAAVAAQEWNDRALFEPLSDDSSQMLAEVREQLGTGAAQDDWTVWSRWFLADRSTRTISPFSKITVPEYIENRLKERPPTPAALDAAERAALGNPELLRRIQAAREALGKP